jgi:hypothetical protein
MKILQISLYIYSCFELEQKKEQKEIKIWVIHLLTVQQGWQVPVDVLRLLQRMTQQTYPEGFAALFLSERLERRICWMQTESHTQMFPFNRDIIRWVSCACKPVGRVIMFGRCTNAGSWSIPCNGNQPN